MSVASNYIRYMVVYSSRFEELVAACPGEVSAKPATPPPIKEYFLSDYGELTRVQEPTLSFTSSLLYYYSVH